MGKYCFDALSALAGEGRRVQAQRSKVEKIDGGKVLYHLKDLSHCFLFLIFLILCDESLLDIGESLYTDVSQLTYNVCKVMHAITHATKDTPACEPGKGPFLQG